MQHNENFAFSYTIQQYLDL